MIVWEKRGEDIPIRPATSNAIDLKVFIKVENACNAFLAAMSSLLIAISESGFPARFSAQSSSYRVGAMNSDSQKTVTTRTLAVLAGVSQATVSLALRDHPSISPAMRSRIQNLAEKAGYRVNPFVSALMTQQRQAKKRNRQETLGFVMLYASLEEFISAFHTHEQYYRGALQQAGELGFGVDIICIKPPALNSARASKMIQARGIRGLIVFPSQKNRSHLKWDWNPFAASTIGYTLVQPGMERSETHLFRAMVLACRKARHQGYRRLGLAMGSADDQRSDHFFTGGFAVGQQLFDEKNRLPVFQPAWSGWNEKTFTRWLRRHQPDVVLSMHPKVMQWIVNAGLRVPDEVAFLDLNCKSPQGPYSGLYLNAEEVGSAAASQVVTRLMRNQVGLQSIPRSILIEPAWVAGSTLPFRR